MQSICKTHSFLDYFTGFYSYLFFRLCKSMTSVVEIAQIIGLLPCTPSQLCYQWQHVEISHGGRIYTIKNEKCYKQGNSFSEPVVKHLAMTTPWERRYLLHLAWRNGDQVADHQRSWAPGFCSWEDGEGQSRVWGWACPRRQELKSNSWFIVWMEWINVRKLVHNTGLPWWR